jgi:hypothetical protein
MSRRNRQAAAEQAAMQASEAGRILQAQRQTEEPAIEPATPKSDADRPPSRNEPRRLAMEEIERRDLETKGITAEPEAPVQETPAPAPEQPETAPEAPTEPEVAPTPEAPVEPAVEMVTVKVDGEESQVPKSEVEDYGGVKAYQMAKAAENRLKKSNEALTQTRQTQAALVQWIQQQQATQQQQVTPQQFLASKIDVIRYGTPEESAAALQEVLEKANPRLDQNAITQQAVTKMQQALAVEKFKEEFADVVSNPLVLKLAMTLENERLGQMQQAGHTPDWQSFYKQLGNEVRSVIRPSQPTTPASTPSTPSPVVDKEARKASIVTLPTAAARAELPKESKPETREDALAAMRKARGLPTG